MDNKETKLLTLVLLCFSVSIFAQTTLDEEYYEREEEVIQDDTGRALDSGSAEAVEAADDRADRLDEDKKRDKDYTQ